MSTISIPFAKMNGIGNKIIVADMRQHAGDITTNAAVSLASNEATQFDQLMAIHATSKPELDATIRILNSDGSEAGACGNGMRCVVDYLHRENGQTEFVFKTLAGLLTATRYEDARISVDMGKPRFEWDQIPLEEEFADTRGIELEVGPIGEPILHTPSVANMGNPHCIFWADKDVNSYALDKFGPMLEHHMIFPESANISVAQVTGEDELTMRTWERGVGETLACGSAACAAAVCAARTGRTGKSVTVNPPGGTLQIEWLDNGSVLLTGRATHEFDGILDPSTGDFERAT